MSAMDEIQKRVRADALSMGRTQTPVVFGLVERGLTIPALREEDQFRRAFPEIVRSRISDSIADLADVGIPETIVEAWEDRFPEGLNDLQVTAVNDHGVLEGESLVVVAPTSAGKTFIAEMAAVRAIADGRKVVFLLPSGPREREVRGLLSSVGR